MILLKAPLTHAFRDAYFPIKKKDHVAMKPTQIKHTPDSENDLKKLD